MPFLHENNGNVTITPAPGGRNFSANSSAARDIGRIQRILAKEVSGASASAQLQSQQQRLAQKKLQMSKIMANGGATLSPALMSFQRSPSMGGSNNNHIGHSSSSSSQNQNDPMFVASRRARSNNFTLKETFDLLKIWASPDMQWQMKHNFRNFRVWEAISYSMHEMGHERTAIQCKNRIQNLTSIFYRIKKSKQDYRSFNFPYYKLIGDILDGKKNGSSGGSSSLSGVPGLNHSAFSNNGGSGNNSLTISPTNPNASAGFAAHLALVEEYQHLINGNPEVYITQSGGGRSSSRDSSSGLNVLSPEVNLSEGNSPIRMDHPSRSSNQPSSSKNGNTAQSGKNGIVTGNNSIGSLLKIEHDDSVNVTVEDSSFKSEMEQDPDNNSDLDESILGPADESQSDPLMDGFPASRTKRSFSASFYNSKPFVGGPMKRPRGASTSTNSGLADDPIAQYLSEMVEIERQWLDMERERADNERQMMMYMMQILQALVCPTQGNDEENEGEGDDGENEEDADGEGEGDIPEFNENEESEIRQMIENEEEREEGDDEEGN